MPAEQEIDRIVRERWFPDVARGTMIEVGAAKPDYLSIGESYRRLGWRVIAVEPNPHFCDLHRAAGNEVYAYACSDADREDVEFYVVDSHAAAYQDGEVTFESFSSLGLSPEFERELEKSKANPAMKTIRVQVRRLDTILREHLPEVSTVDLLAVDVEGWEIQVMEGFNVERYRPKVIILENLFKSRAYRRYMRKRGYTRRLRLKPNEVYVRDDGGSSLRSWLRR